MSDLKMTSGINKMNLKKRKNTATLKPTIIIRSCLEFLLAQQSEFAAIQGDPSYVPKMMPSHPYDGVDPSLGVETVLILDSDWPGSRSTIFDEHVGPYRPL